MSFLTGAVFLDAPASALNNAGLDQQAGTKNVVATKVINAKGIGVFPYVSAQAFRNWLRTTLERERPNGWTTSPIERKDGKKGIAYTSGDPIQYCDDDLFGYVRAIATEKKAKGRKNTDSASSEDSDESEDTNATVTRISPLRVSTFLSLAPSSPILDYGTMSRQEDNAVLYQHQFYRAVLKGLFSLDLHAVGTFSYIRRTGYRNLDEIRIKQAKEAGLTEITEEKSYRLGEDERRNRVASLLEGLSTMSGGAKQALHYTDITPAIVLAMVTKGGNNPLQYVIVPDKFNGLPTLHLGALRQMIEAWSDQIESPLYVGWIEGFCDDQREILQNVLAGKLENQASLPSLPHGYELGHPRQILQQLAESFKKSENAAWLA